MFGIDGFPYFLQFSIKNTLNYNTTQLGSFNEYVRTIVFFKKLFMYSFYSVSSEK